MSHKLAALTASRPCFELEPELGGLCLTPNSAVRGPCALLGPHRVQLTLDDPLNSLFFITAEPAMSPSVPWLSEPWGYGVWTDCSHLGWRLPHMRWWCASRSSKIPACPAAYIQGTAKTAEVVPCLSMPQMSKKHLELSLRIEKIKLPWNPPWKKCWGLSFLSAILFSFTPA